jgi:hypothetical protein
MKVYFQAKNTLFIFGRLVMFLDLATNSLLAVFVLSGDQLDTKWANTGLI